MPASRSLIALLIGTVVFFALWMVALKPSSKSGGNSSSPSLVTSAANKARHAVATANANQTASGNENAGSSSGGTTAAQTPSQSSTSTTASKPKTTPAAKVSTSKSSPVFKHSLADEMGTVKTAVTEHKVVALLFYNPAASDDRALKRELASVPTHKGRVVKLAVPLDQSGNFSAVTQQVPVNLSPTLVVISRNGDVTEDVGYTAPFVIDQQVDNALAAS